jgi:hypothetical protein
MGLPSQLIGTHAPLGPHASITICKSVRALNDKVMDLHSCIAHRSGYFAWCDAAGIGISEVHHVRHGTSGVSALVQ